MSGNPLATPLESSNRASVRDQFRAPEHVPETHIAGALPNADLRKLCDSPKPLDLAPRVNVDGRRTSNLALETNVALRSDIDRRPATDVAAEGNAPRGTKRWNYRALKVACDQDLAHFQPGEVKRGSRGQALYAQCADPARQHDSPFFRNADPKSLGGVELEPEGQPEGQALRARPDVTPALRKVQSSRPSRNFTNGAAALLTAILFVRTLSGTQQETLP
jgi:hypothetical protein